MYTFKQFHLWKQKTNLMSLAVLSHFLCAQHVSDINIPIIRSLRILCWITTLVVLFLVRCVLVFRCGWVGVVSALCVTNVVIQQNRRKPLMMDILMSATCWAHKKWNKNGKWLQVGLLFSAITMMHGPINISFIFVQNICLSIVNRYTIPNYIRTGFKKLALLHIFASQ